MRGASRGVLEVGQVRRPRAGDETHPPSSRAAPGLRPGTLGSLARELADGGLSGLPEAQKTTVTQKAPASASRRRDETERQKARPGAVTTPHGAPRGARVPAKERGTKRQWSRHPALHSLAFRGGLRKVPPRRGMGYGVPGAAKNMGGEAWLLCKQPPNNDNAMRQRQGLSCPASSAPPAACNMRQATKIRTCRRRFASSARKSGNTCRRAGKAGPRSRRCRKAT